MSPFNILLAIALLLTVLSMIWRDYPLLPVAVLLVIVSLFVGR